MPSDRRQFLKSSALLTGASTVGAQQVAGQTPKHMDLNSQTTFRKQLLECLGGEWPQSGPLNVQVIRSEQKDGYQLQWVTYEAEPEDRVPAIVLVPDSASEAAPSPAIALWHQHAGQWHLGKTEPAGLAGDPSHHTGVAFAKLGYIVLCPDAQCFEERQDPDGKLKGGAYERFEFLHQVVNGRCMAWKNILDMRRGIDYLVQRSDVDAGRIGCYGHSMGSTHTWLAGPWEPRLKCLVGNCCLPTYKAIRRTKLLHCFPNFIPGLEQYGDTPDIVGLIAPRPVHLNFGENDHGSPIEEVKDAVKSISHAYALQNASEQFSYFIQENTGHVLSEAMWAQTRNFFARHLAG